MKLQGFVNDEEILKCVDEWVSELRSKNYDLIIGIPRSGLMIASMIAVKLGKSLSTPDAYIKNMTWKSKNIPNNTVKKILLVDDSVALGNTLLNYHTLVKEFDEKVVVDRGALFIREHGMNKVDEFHGVIPEITMFQFALTHQKLGSVGFDMDGVLCDDCTLEIVSDNVKYLDFLKNVKPKIIPIYKIDYIITSRIEKYRDLTEEWLKNNGVQYEKLIMWNTEDRSKESFCSWEYKSNMIDKLNLDYFIESNSYEAEPIWELTGVPTIATDKMILFNENYGKKSYIKKGELKNMKTPVETLYDEVLQNPTEPDMLPFMPFLRRISTGNDVIEFGVRNGVSTAGLLAGRPKKMLSYDLNSFQFEERYKKHAEESGVNWTFIRGSSLDAPKLYCDVLFIDTVHDYWCCDKELYRHADMVQKYIILHDTNLHTPWMDVAPWVDPASGKGNECRTYWIAILKLLEKTIFTENGPKKQWHLLGEIKNDCGLTVLVNSRMVEENANTIKEVNELKEMLIRL